MSKYKESAVAGSKWTRSRGVTILNPLEGGQEAIFQEEEVVSLGDGTTMNRDVGACSMAFDPVAGRIPLLNPTTGEPIGTEFNHADLYIVLYSLYIQAAKARDAA
jgi:hypothetical protein